MLRLTARYASWRDRKLRRLAQLEALSDEVWPDPAAYTRQLVEAVAAQRP